MGAAVEAYSAAIAMDPQNSTGYARRGTVLLALKSTKAAMEDLGKALELDPSLDSARIARAKGLAEVELFG